MKKIIKPILKQAAFYAGVDASLRALRSVVRKNSILILMYHRISPDTRPYLDLGITPRMFEKQIGYLKKHYRIASLSDLENGDRLFRSAKPPVLLTFDDGYKDNFTYAFPILQKYNATALIFVVTGFTDTRRIPWYDRLYASLSLAGKPYFTSPPDGELPLDLKNLVVRYFQSGKKNAALVPLIDKCRFYDDQEREIYLTELSGLLKSPALPQERIMLNRDEIRYMAKNGISFAPHTVSHHVLANLNMKEAEKEIKDSVKTIENLTHQPVVAFAYPYGKKRHYSEENILLLQKIGFKFAFTAESGRETYPFRRPFEIKRKGAPQTPYIF